MSDMAYRPRAATSEEVAVIHNHLWMALNILPHHKHRSQQAADNCNACVGWQRVIKAYKALPEAR